MKKMRFYYRGKCTMYTFTWDDGDITRSLWKPIRGVSFCCERPIDSIRLGHQKLINYYNKILREKL